MEDERIDDDGDLDSLIRGSSSVIDLERQLRQKLVLLESAVARISSTKLQLKDNSDLVKKEIRQCFGHQLSCLRCREQQLLNRLDTVVTLKDELLTEQQDRLHQALGACQQGLQCLKSTVHEVYKRGGTAANPAPLEVVEHNLEEILNRLSGLTLHPCESAHVTFDADPMSVRRTLESFGRINTSRALKESESMPADLEDYDDDDQGERNLMHKPFNQVSAGGVVISSLRRPKLTTDVRTSLLREALTGSSSGVQKRPQSTSGVRGSRAGSGVGNWLRQIKTSVELEPAVFEDYGVSRDRLRNAAESDGDCEETSTALFVGFFKQIEDSPLDNWLLKSDVSGGSEIVMNNNEHDMDEGTNDDEQSYCYLSTADDEQKSGTPDHEVPANLQWSSSTILGNVDTEAGPPANFLANYERYLHTLKNDQWLLATTTLLKDHQSTVAVSAPVVQTAPAANERPHAAPPCRPIVSDTSDQDRWLLPPPVPADGWLLPPTPTSNACAADVATYESVLGWQAVLERIHAGGDEKWLLSK